MTTYSFSTICSTTWKIALLFTLAFFLNVQTAQASSYCSTLSYPSMSITVGGTTCANSAANPDRVCTINVPSGTSLTATYHNGHAGAEPYTYVGDSWPGGSDTHASNANPVSSPANRNHTSVPITSASVFSLGIDRDCNETNPDGTFFGPEIGGSVVVNVTVTTSAPTCSASPASVATGGSTTLTGAGGSSGSYTWSAPGANTTSGTGNTFSTSYASTGTKIVTVTRNGQSSTCTVNVTSASTPSCSASPASVATGVSTRFTGAGGSSGSYTWSAPGANTASGSGTTFDTSYASTGTKIVTVTRSGVSNTCSVSVTSQPVTNGQCQTPPDGGTYATAPTPACTAGTASGISGTGPWTWTCAGINGGTTDSCSAQRSTTPPINGACQTPPDGGTYATAPTPACTAGTASGISGTGPWTWTCAGSNGGTTDSCSANIQGAGAPSVNLQGKYSDGGLPFSEGPVQLPAGGGNVNLRWIVSGNATSCTASASPAVTGWTGSKTSSPDGTYAQTNIANSATVRTYTITCSNAGGSDSDSVAVTITTPPAGLACSPATQQVGVLVPASIEAMNAVVPYTWNTGGSPVCTANMTPCTPAYGAVGTKTVSLTSEGVTRTCEVVVKGSVRVVSNQPTTWSVTRSSGLPLEQTTASQSATYDNQRPGVYSLVNVPTLAGFQPPVISPVTASQSIPNTGSDITFTITYNPVEPPPCTGDECPPPSDDDDDDTPPDPTDPPQCSDEKDNDGDTFIDYPNDPGCSGPNDDTEVHQEPECRDGYDNADPEDEDMRNPPFDANDPGCHTDGNPNNPSSYNRDDNNERDTPIGAVTQCNNGLDDDGDGKVDYVTVRPPDKKEDLGCASETDPSELDDPIIEEI